MPYKTTKADAIAFGRFLYETGRCDIFSADPVGGGHYILRYRVGGTWHEWTGL